jgi:hypothetical protein
MSAILCSKMFPFLPSISIVKFYSIGLGRRMDSDLCIARCSCGGGGVKVNSL